MVDDKRVEVRSTSRKEDKTLEGQKKGKEIEDSFVLFMTTVNTTRADGSCV